MHKLSFKPAEFLFNNRNLAIVWLVVRLYVGWIWLMAGWEKVISDKWVGQNAGAAVSGFMKGALQKTSGDHPDVQSWYAWFINNVALPNAELFSYLVAFGELLVGIGLILGAFTAVAAFFGLVMNFNYLFAGAISMNPLLIILQLLIIMAWRTSGLIGLDKFIYDRLPASVRNKFFENSKISL